MKLQHPECVKWEKQVKQQSGCVASQEMTFATGTMVLETVAATHCYNAFILAHVLCIVETVFV